MSECLEKTFGGGHLQLMILNIGYKSKRSNFIFERALYKLFKKYFTSFSSKLILKRHCTSHLFVAFSGAHEKPVEVPKN